MGRLFWKFFLIFWLAQMCTSLGVGLAIWAEHRQLFASTIRGETEHPGSFRQGNDMSAPPGRPEYPDFPSPGRRYDMPPHMGPDPLHPPHRREGFFPPLLPMIAGSFASLIFAALLAWYFSRPIRSLRTAFDEVANGKLDTRIGSSMGGRNDELADLGQDFDRMASRLQGLMEAQRRLLHDISHELRSPLARLQAATDLMQQQPDRAAEFISRLERDTGRIDSLVGELLTLARLDSGMTGRMDETVDVHEILDHISNDASFEAKSRRCVVEVSLPEEIYIKGNRELIFRALENIVRNAVLHSPEDSRVDVAVTRDVTGQWMIDVADQGPGVSSEDMEAIFEPFFRSKTSGGYSGYGLGLAIARRVVQAHGGLVTAANRPRGGLIVTVILPALSS